MAVDVLLGKDAGRSLLRLSRSALSPYSRTIQKFLCLAAWGRCTAQNRAFFRCHPGFPPPTHNAPVQSSPAPQPGQQSVQFPVTALAAGAAVLAAAAAAVFLLVRKKKAAPALEAPGIYMRLEVVQGELAGKKTEWNLVSELSIGRDQTCDIVFSSQTLSKKNSRVFTVDGAVYLEDLNSQNGTLVNGNRIDMANILRSGDEITIGDVVFRLKF